MAENAPDQTETTAPVDYRPRPRYGELAPEGWTWTPPQDAQAPAASAEHPPAPTPVTPGPVDRPAGAAPGWDRPLTATLLVLGLLGTFIIVSMLQSMPEAFQTLYTQAGLGTYTAAESVPAIIAGGSIGQVVIWLATAALSILLTVRRRRAFYVPLIGGVVSFVLLVAAMAVVLAGDTALLDYFSQP